MRKIRKKDSKTFLIVNFLLLFAVAFISVGYSAFNETLSISVPIANVRIIKDIRVTNVRVLNNELSGLSNLSTSYIVDNTFNLFGNNIVEPQNIVNYNSTYEYVDYGVDSISSKIVLPDDDSKITFGVEITNIGNAESGILDIIGLPSELEYELTGYNLKDKICDSYDKCKLGITKEIFITIGYKNNANTSPNTSFDINLTFDFEEFVGITYSGLSSNYLPEIIKGGTLEINVPNDSDSYFVIKVGGIETTDYTYVNEILTIPDVSDTLEIEKKIRTYPFNLTVNPQTATIAYKINGVSQTSKTGTLSDEYPMGTTISVTISNDGYKTETRNYTMGYQAITDSISLIKLWTFKLTPNPSDSTVKITINGVEETVTGTYTSQLLEEGTSISWEVSRDYFSKKTGTYSNISKNENLSVSLDMHAEKTATITFGSDDKLSASTYNKEKSVNITANSKIVSATSSGTLNNGIAKTENSFSVTTNNNFTLLNKSELSSSASGKRDVGTSATWTIFNAPVANSVTAKIGKSGWIAVVTPDITVTIKYVEK